MLGACPKCEIPLLTLSSTNRGSVARCQRCRGNWLDANQILSALGSNGARLVQIDDKATFIDSSLFCPVCLSPTLVSVILPGNDVPPFEKCKKCHGVWLDDTEVTTVKGPRAELKMTSGGATPAPQPLSASVLPISPDLSSPEVRQELRNQIDQHSPSESFRSGIEKYNILTQMGGQYEGRIGLGRRCRKMGITAVCAALLLGGFGALLRGNESAAMALLILGYIVLGLYLANAVLKGLVGVAAIPFDREAAPQGLALCLCASLIGLVGFYCAFF